MVGERHKARVLALQALYEVDAAGHNSAVALDNLLEGMPVSGETRAFVFELVSGVIAHREEIDRNIRQFAPAWPLEQMSMVDRNILRLAIFEMVLHRKVPVRVAINEAVELAKAFGSDNSPKFINGVLGSVSSLVASQ